MKKIIIGFMSLFLVLFTVTGCGKSDDKKADGTSKAGDSATATTASGKAESSKTLTPEQAKAAVITQADVPDTIVVSEGSTGGGLTVRGNDFKNTGCAKLDEIGKKYPRDEEHPAFATVHSKGGGGLSLDQTSGSVMVRSTNNMKTEFAETKQALNECKHYEMNMAATGSNMKATMDLAPIDVKTSANETIAYKGTITATGGKPMQMEMINVRVGNSMATVVGMSMKEVDQNLLQTVAEASAKKLEKA